MSIARIGDISLEYYVEGVGPLLLMITPLAWNADMWGEPFLAQLREHFTIIRFSNRGTGLTDKPEVEYSIGTMAEDAAGVVRHVTAERVHVFGASMGGTIAQELALEHPNLVDRLVLGCTICGWANGVRPSLDSEPEAPALRQPASAKEYMTAMTSLLTSPQFVREGSGFLANLLRILADRATPSNVMVKQEAAVNAFDSYDRLPQLRSPTLILHGDADRMVPIANADILAGRIPDAQVKIISGGGHAFMWQYPDVTAEIITQFLTEIPIVAE